MIQKAFVDDAMGAAQVKVWHKCFRDGQESVESDACSLEGLQQAEHLRTCMGCNQQRLATASGRTRS